MRKFLKNLFRKKKSSNKKIISEIGKGKDQEINEENFKDKIKYEEEKLKKTEFFLNKSLEINPKDITALNKLKKPPKVKSKDSRKVIDDSTKLEIYNAAVAREKLENSYRSILVKKNEWHCIPNPNKKEEKNLYRKYLAEVKKIEKKSEEKGLKMTWSYDYLDDNCKEIRGDKFQPIYISKDQLKQNEFTEEEIQNVISKWERKPSYEFLLPDWHAAVEAGRWVNRGRFRNDTPEDKSMDYHRISRNFHLLNTYQLRKLYRNKISYETSNKTNTFYIVKIKVQLNNRKEFTIYKPGICANKVLGGRYVKNNENKIQSVIEVRNIHWHVAACLEEKTQYYMNAKPWLPMLYSHELIDSDMHGYFNDFYHKDFEMFEERYGACKNEIWNFNRKILEEMKNAQKRRFFSYAENSYLHIRGDIDYKENKKRDREVEKIYNQRIKEIEKLRKRLRRDYFKKIPKPKESDNLWDYLKGGHTEFRIWDDSEENLFVWIKLLLSFEKEKLDKYKNKPEVVFQRSI